MFTDLWVQAFQRIARPYHVPLRDQGMVLVVGENRDGGDATDNNGAAKSLSIVEAPLWCLWQRMARYDDKIIAADARHPRHGADVMMGYERNGAALRIRRFLPTKGKGEFTIQTPDGKPFEHSLDTTTRTEDVGALLGMDYAAFRTAVVVSGEYSLAKAGFAGQMAVLESLMRLSELSGAAEVARRRVSAWDQQVTAAEATVRVRAEVLHTAETFLASTRGTLTIDNELDELAEALDAAKSAFTASVAMEAALGTLRQRYAAQVATVNRQMADITTLETQRAAITIPSVKCEACGRPYQRAAQLRQAQKRARAAVAAVDKALGAAQTGAAKESRVLNALAQQIQTDERAWRQVDAHGQQVAGLEAQIAQLQRQRDTESAAVKRAETAVADARIALVDAEAHVTTLCQRRSRPAYWVQWYGRDAMQADVFQQYMPVLNTTAERYAQALTNGAIGVTFNPLRDKKNEELIRITGGSAPTYKGLSSGEKQRVDLVVALSLRELARQRTRGAAPINFSVYDEVFDHIDAAGLAVVATLLQQEVDAGATVFIVTHNPDLKRLFPGAKVLQAVREGGESTVQYLA